MSAIKAGKHRGFTIVELLIVIVVIAILAAISIVAYNGIQVRAKASQLATDLRNISTTVQQYEIDNGSLPCFDHLWDDTQEISWAAPYMKWPRNPAGNRYHFEHFNTATSVSISIQNLGADLAQQLDSSIDNGDLASGTVQGNGSRLEYYGLQQVITSHPGDDC